MPRVCDKVSFILAFNSLEENKIRSANNANVPIKLATRRTP